MVRVLFIDDDVQAHKTLDLVLPEQYTLLSAYTARQGIEAAARDAPDVVLLDINLPDMDGIAALRNMLARPCAAPVLMVTALSDHRLVKDAIMAGASDYIVKPYEVKELLGSIRTAVGGADARRAAAAALEADSLPAVGGLLGESGGMEEVRQLVLRYARSDSPVMVLGESGTGKELVARALHDASRRRERPFVALNCGALPETLLESELFGAERGAFTDAVTRPGSFERAGGGTLFLDEIGELSRAAQTRLLRVIEQKELTRVGGTRAIALDVRVVSATNRDLKAAVASSAFRNDLFYRLGVLPIHIPPLRERAADIPLLAAHFLALLGRSDMEIGADAREKLLAHPWPGNIRELRNILERAVLAADGGPLRAGDLTFD